MTSPIGIFPERGGPKLIEKKKGKRQDKSNMIVVMKYIPDREIKRAQWILAIKEWTVRLPSND